MGRLTALTNYERGRLQYLEYYEGYPERKGGLDQNERVELFRLREKLSELDTKGED